MIIVLRPDATDEQIAHVKKSWRLLALLFSVKGEGAYGPRCYR